MVNVVTNDEQFKLDAAKAIVQIMKKEKKSVSVTTEKQKKQVSVMTENETQNKTENAKCDNTQELSLARAATLEFDYLTASKKDKK